MKIYFAFLMMILSYAMNGQGQKVTIDTIINSKIISKDSIFDKIQYYLATAITDSRAAIELQNKNTHSFLLNPTTDVEFTTFMITTIYTIKFKLEILIKDGRVRIKTSDHKMISGTNSSGTSIHKNPTPILDNEKVTGFNKKTSENWKKQIMDTTVKMVDDIYKSLNDTKKDDW